MQLTEAAIEPGAMVLVQSTPNPFGAEEARLFLLLGDATAAPVQWVIPAEGVAFPSPLSSLEKEPFRLTILHFNDLHGQLSRFTPRGCTPVFSRMVHRARQLRRECRRDPHRAVLFLSAGDDLVGSIFGELLRDDSGSGLPDHGAVHASYQLYSAAGVDAGALGNHDFDHGAGVLAQAIQRDARFPLLSANLKASPSLSSLVYPAALLLVKGLRVGLIGLTTGAQARCGQGSDLCLTHPLTAARNLIPALYPLCDVLIILSHLGHSLQACTASTCDAGDAELAQGLAPDSVHLIIGGHTHQTLHEAGLGITHVVNGIPIVQAGAMGRFLGEVEITVGGGSPGRLRAAEKTRSEVRAPVAITSAQLISTSDLSADRGFERKHVQPLLDRSGPILTQRLGRVEEHPDLWTDAVRNQFSDGESALANFITDALVACCRAAGYLVDLAAVDASSICCGLPVGSELTFADWFNVMPYADSVRLCRLTAEQLAALLDDNARRTARPGEPNLERGFLHFSRQVRYTIELGEDRAAATAVGISVGRRPLDHQWARTFLVACTSFVRQAAAPWAREAAFLGHHYVQDAFRSDCTDIDLFVRDALVAHIRERGGVTAASGARRDGRLSIT